MLYPSPYGHFEPETGDYVIRDVLTPRPWVNVLANGTYGVVLSQTGGGFSWRGSCQAYRLTRWEQDLAVDAYGRWLYLADPESGLVDGLQFGPTKTPGDDEVRVGQGFTTFKRTTSLGVLSETTVFVPEDEPCEYWIVRLTNPGPTARSLRFGTYLDWHLGTNGDAHREFHRLFVSLEVRGNSLLAWKRSRLSEGKREVLETPLVASLTVSGLQNPVWLGDKAEFLGRAGRLDRPDALLGNPRPGTTGRWDDPIAGLVAPVEIAPGETRTIILRLGAYETAEEAMTPVSGEAEEKLRATVEAHQRRFACLKIDTGFPALDLMVNRWLPYQAHVARMRGSTGYYQQSGAFGFRDQLQDSLLFLDTDPALTMDQIGRNAEAMYEDGGVRHWWFPDGSIFVESHHSDTCMWLAYATLAYLDETGDRTALDRDYAFLSRQTQREASRGTLLDHCRRGIDRALSRRSERGLPLIGAGDWNDGLSHAGLDGRGESVWDAMFLFGILRRFAPVLAELGFQEEADRYLQEAESLRQAVETHGWEGDRYIAGTNDLGLPFGSHENEQGSLFLNPQTWGVITELARPDRASRALETVQTELVQPYGTLLLKPAYRRVDPHIGYISRYAPGLRENGGVYSHASVWSIQAFAMVGQANIAWDITRAMLPPLRAEVDADRYAAEPYVTPGNTDGPDSPFEGRAGWTWYTGSAAWLRRTILHWILGVRPEDGGLLIAPNLPPEIGGFTMERPFRGDLFAIEVTGHAPYAVEVDGVPQDKPWVAASGQGRSRTIRLKGV